MTNYARLAEESLAAANVGMAAPASNGRARSATLPAVALTRCAADIQIVPIRWLWPGYIPAGKLTLLVGDPSAGKTTISLDIAACIASGTAMPDGKPIGEPAGILVLSAEDDAGDTLVPRLKAALEGRDRAAIKRIHVVGSVLAGDVAIQFPGHVPMLAALVEQHAAKLLLIDPLDAFLGGADSHKNASVRGVLAPLCDMAARSGCAILGIQHLRKAATASPIHRPSGSIAFAAAARSVLLAGSRPDDETGARALVPIKSNLAALPASLGYRIESAGDGEPAFVTWTGTVDVGADEMLMPPLDPDERRQREHVADVLHGALKEGPKSLTELQGLMKGSGLSDIPGRTLRWVLKNKVGAKSSKAGPGCTWVWSL